MRERPPALTLGVAEGFLRMVASIHSPGVVAEAAATEATEAPASTTARNTKLNCFSIVFSVFLDFFFPL
jgi:hypothetical protein